jgi:hypothetical protein
MTAEMELPPAFRRSGSLRDHGLTATVIDEPEQEAR